jgi:hypothetical protein
MSDLGTQVGKLLNRRFNSVAEKAGVPFLKEVFEAMKQLTSAGGTFQGLQYKSFYETKYFNRRKKLGYNSPKVNLRLENKRIETPTTPAYTKHESEIGFKSGGDVFYAHQYGTGKGGYIREIFPKEWQNVPPDIINRLRKRVADIMNGRNV